MAQILVRDLPDYVKNNLKQQATRNGRSMEAEAREILTRATTVPNIALRLYEATRDIDGAGDDFVLPERNSTPRNPLEPEKPNLAYFCYEATRGIGGIEEDELPIPPRTDMPRTVDFS